MRRLTGILLLTCLLIGGTGGMGWAIDPALQRVQQQLSDLGYDPGMIDGVLGPRTRQALEAFQREKQLPVTGNPDPRTLEALDQALLPNREAEPRTPLPEVAPLRIVLEYFRFYPSQPARILPYVTARFRDGLSPSDWLAQTLETFSAQPYAYLTWKVQRLILEDAVATVFVHTRVQVQGQEIAQQEVFTLIRGAESDWLIDAWRVEPLPPEEVPRAGS